MFRFWRKLPGFQIVQIFGGKLPGFQIVPDRFGSKNAQVSRETIENKES